MVKGLIWLGKLIAAGLMISFLSIWTTGYIVTSYVESVMKQFQLPIDVPPIAMSGVWGKLWGSDPLLTADKEEQGNQEINSPKGSDGTLEVFGNTEEQPVKAGDTEAIREGDGEADNDLDRLTETVGPERVDRTGKAGIDGTETAITTDQIEAAKEGMSEEDKAQLFELLMTKLPPESWQQISIFMESGLTEQELLNVEQLMAQHLDKDEYDRMMVILKKY